MHAQFNAIEQFLPSGGVQSVLDIGGGMGGIDVLLNQYYGGGLEIGVIDGLEDPAEVKSHAETFSSWKIASEFLYENGVKNATFFDPVEWSMDKGVKAPAEYHNQFDLIISLQAWCFHFAPSVYMPAVLQAAKPGAVLCLDVRNERQDWMRELISTDGLEPIGRRDGRTDKYSTLAFLVEK